MTPEQIAVVIASLLGAGGLTGAVAAWRRAGPETRATEVATIRSVMEELRLEMADDRKTAAACREALERAHWEVQQTRSEMRRLEVKVTVQRQRIDRLEEFIRLNTDFDPEDINGSPI